MTALERIVNTLRDVGVEWRQVQHEPVRTSEKAAHVRSEPLEIGGKALVVKANQDFLRVAISAARRWLSSRLKQTLSAGKLRFATSEELEPLATLVLGCVPLFRKPDVIKVSSSE